MTSFSSKKGPIPKVHTYHDEGYHTVVWYFKRHLSNEKVGVIDIEVGAALIKNYSSYVQNKKSSTCFSPKLVLGDQKPLPDRWQTLLPSSPILADFVEQLLSKIDPLGIECITFVLHACNSGSTVARGQHFSMPL